MSQKIVCVFYLLLIFLIVVDGHVIPFEYSTSNNYSEKKTIGKRQFQSDENKSYDSSKHENTSIQQLSPSNLKRSRSNSKAEKTKSLEKVFLSAKNYVIPSESYDVFLNDSSKKGIPNEEIRLVIKDKLMLTLIAITNDEGIAKFNLTNAFKTTTTTIDLIFDGSSQYKGATKTRHVRVIDHPIYTQLSLEEKGVIQDDFLKVFLKTEKGKAIAKQKITFILHGKTSTATTDRTGLAKLFIDLPPNKYNLTVNYFGKNNYIGSKKSTKINILRQERIGKNRYGTVDFIRDIGNEHSTKRIAYIVGVHCMEHPIHDSVYRLLKNRMDLNYHYMIYNITVTDKTGTNAALRMRGQRLAKAFVVPHIERQSFDLVVDVHSTRTYEKTYFIHVPENRHEPSLLLANRTIATIQRLEKDSDMCYWSPLQQTSPPFIHLPLMRKGIPTFIFETWTYEEKSQTDRRAKFLVEAVDQLFD